MTTKNAGEKEQGMSEGPYKVGYQRGYHTVIDGSGVIVYSDDTSGGVNMFADAANYAHAHATDAAARRVRELEEALAAMVRAFESGWPSHATESIGGLGHMPGESCNACRMMRPYKDAQSALAGKERTDGAE